MDVGILGGTFDPIHKGHLGIAIHAMDTFSLESILLIPAGNPWLKSGQVISGSIHRVAMATLVAKEDPRLFVSEIETNRPGPSFTVDTLEELHKMYGTKLTLYLILGLDAFYNIPLWRNPNRIFELANMIVVSRPGVKDQSFRESLDKGLLETPDSPLPMSEKRTMPIRYGRVNFLDGPNFDISATEIRQRVAKGCTIDGWVSDNVRQYIQKHRLYQEEGSR